MNRFQVRNISFFVFILLFSQSCGTTEISTQNTVTTTETTISTPEVIINTTPSPIITVELTPTFFPDISNPKEFVIDMIQNNGGCNLPCLIGVTPNTDTLEVRKFVNHFENLNMSIENSDKGLGIDSTISYKFSNLAIQISESVKNYNSSWTFSIENNKLSRLSMHSWVSQNLDNGVKLLNADFYYNELFSYFTLTKILGVYGKPEKILISTFQDSPDYSNAIYPYTLVLFYPEKGFLIQYTMPRTQEGDYYLGCPTKSIIDISAWNPHNQITLEMATEGISSGIGSINPLNISYFKSIEDATELTPDLFQEMFKLNSENNCIKTPQDLWIPLE